jgi:hypothetical protein
LIPLTERRLTNATKKSKGKGVKNIRPEKIPPPRKNISPVIFFETYSKKILVFSNSPCRETPKNALKKKKKKKVRTYLFLRAGADVRRFLVLNFLPPLTIQRI